MERTFTTTTEFTGLLKSGNRHPRLLTHEDRARDTQFKVAQALLKGQLKDLVDDVRCLMLNDKNTEANRVFHDAVWQIDGTAFGHRSCGEQIQEAFWIAALSMPDIEVELDYEVFEENDTISDVILTVEGISIPVEDLNKLDRDYLTSLCEGHWEEHQTPARSWTAKDVAYLKPGVAS